MWERREKGKAKHLEKEGGSRHWYLTPSLPRGTSPWAFPSTVRVCRVCAHGQAAEGRRRVNDTGSTRKAPGFLGQLPGP